MKRFVYFVVIFFIVLLFPKDISAIYDPISVDNNIYGLHVADPVDIQKAKYLVNSSEGDWGYVTLVIRENERNLERWQEVFNELRRKHLIPIIRIASKQNDIGWEKFDKSDVDDWVYFLNSLNWVIENRYVVIGNEPNHAKEWGGEINPEEYAQILKEFSVALKDASEDFFILPAGFDASASSSKITLSEEDYLLRMFQHDNSIFTHIDGWVSHSYPNPEFSGSEYGYGKGSIRTFEWELSFIKNLGEKKELPVFITETGWIHNKNEEDSEYYDPDELVSKYDYAFNSVWKKDPRIVAVTPFLLNYNELPFNSFSWIDLNSNKYPFYESVQNHQKVKGVPIQVVEGEILFSLTPKIIKRGDYFQGMMLVINTGQSIWGEGEYEVVIKNPDSTISNQKIISYLEPGDTTLIPVKSNEALETNFEGTAQLYNEGNPFSNVYTLNIEVVENTSLKLILSNILIYIMNMFGRSEF
jgi:hypothetical protein